MSNHADRDIEYHLDDDNDDYNDDQYHHQPEAGPSTPRLPPILSRTSPIIPGPDLDGISPLLRGSPKVETVGQVESETDQGMAERFASGEQVSEEMERGVTERSSSSSGHDPHDPHGLESPNGSVMTRGSLAELWPGEEFHDRRWSEDTNASTEQPKSSANNDNGGKTASAKVPSPKSYSVSRIPRLVTTNLGKIKTQISNHGQTGLSPIKSAKTPDGANTPTGPSLPGSYPAQQLREWDSPPRVVSRPDQSPSTSSQGNMYTPRARKPSLQRSTSSISSSAGSDRRRKSTSIGSPPRPTSKPNGPRHRSRSPITSISSVASGSTNRSERNDTIGVLTSSAPLAPTMSAGSQGSGGSGSGSLRQQPTIPIRGSSSSTEQSRSTSPYHPPISPRWSSINQSDQIPLPSNNPKHSRGQPQKTNQLDVRRASQNVVLGDTAIPPPPPARPPVESRRRPSHHVDLNEIFGPTPPTSPGSTPRRGGQSRVTPHPHPHPYTSSASGSPHTGNRTRNDHSPTRTTTPPRNSPLLLSNQSPRQDRKSPNNLNLRINTPPNPSSSGYEKPSPPVPTKNPLRRFSRPDLNSISGESPRPSSIRSISGESSVRNTAPGTPVIFEEGDRDRDGNHRRLIKDRSRRNSNDSNAAVAPESPGSSVRFPKAPGAFRSGEGERSGEGLFPDTNLGMLRNTVMTTGSMYSQDSAPPSGTSFSFSAYEDGGDEHEDGGDRDRDHDRDRDRDRDGRYRDHREERGGREDSEERRARQEEEEEEDDDTAISPTNTSHATVGGHGVHEMRHENFGWGKKRYSVTSDASKHPPHEQGGLVMTSKTLPKTPTDSTYSDGTTIIGDPTAGTLAIQMQRRVSDDRQQQQQQNMRSPSMPLLGHGSPPNKAARVLGLDSTAVSSGGGGPSLRSTTDPNSNSSNLNLMPSALLRSPTSPNFKTSTPTTPMSKRAHLIREIASSERAYANDLALVRDAYLSSYLRPMSTHSIGTGGESSSINNSLRSPETTTTTASGGGSGRSSFYATASNHSTDTTKRTSAYSTHSLTGLGTSLSSTTPSTPLPKSSGGEYFGSSTGNGGLTSPNNYFGTSASTSNLQAHTSTSNTSGGGPSPLSPMKGFGMGGLGPIKSREQREQRDNTHTPGYGVQVVAKPLSPADIKAVFINLDQLTLAAEDLADQFERAIGDKNEDGVGAAVTPGAIGEGGTDRMGEVFTGIIPRLRPLFTIYCARQANASIRLLELQSDKGHAAWFRECWNKIKSQTHAWNLDSMLIKPIQRITKYPLLFDDLLACTTPVHPDYFAIRNAAELAKSMAMEIDEAKRRKDVVAGVIKRNPPTMGISTSASSISLGSNISKTPKGKGLKIFSKNKGGPISNNSTTTLPSTIRPPPRTPNDANNTDTKPAEILPSSLAFYRELVAKLEEVDMCVRRVGKEVILWTAAAKEVIGAEQGLVNTWMRVIQLEQNDPVDKRLIAFKKVLGEIMGDAWANLNDDVREQVMPALSKLVETMSNPRKVIARRDGKAGDYARYTALKDAKKPIDRVLIDSASDFVALHTQLVEELPTFLEGYTKIFDITLVAFANSQATYYQSIQRGLERFSKSWIAHPRPQPGNTENVISLDENDHTSPGSPGDPATGRGIIKLWRDSWTPYAEAMEHFQCTRPSRGASSRLATFNSSSNIHSRNNSRPASRSSSPSKSRPDLRHSNSMSSQRSATLRPPIASSTKSTSSNRPRATSLLLNASKQDTRASPNAGPRTQATSGSAGYGHAHSRNQGQMPPPHDPIRSPSTNTLPRLFLSAAELSPRTDDRNSAKDRRQANQSPGSSPEIGSRPYKSRSPKDNAGLGLGDFGPSNSGAGGTASSTGSGAASSIAKDGTFGSNPRLDTMQSPRVLHDSPTQSPVISNAQTSNESPYLQQHQTGQRPQVGNGGRQASYTEDAAEGWRNEAVLYQCGVVADFDPKEYGNKRYRKLRFLPVNTGDLIDVFYEVGRIDELPSFPYLDIGVENDGVLVGRAENGDIGLVICSFLEPLM